MMADALTLAAFEKRAASNEARLAQLEKAIMGGQNMEQQSLQELKALLVQAREQAAKVAVAPHVRAPSLQHCRMLPCPLCGLFCALQQFDAHFLALSDIYAGTSIAAQ